MEKTIMEKLKMLPPEQQALVLEFICFLFEKYVESRLQEIGGETAAPDPLSPKMRDYLDGRLAELEEKEEKCFSVEETEAYFVGKNKNRQQDV